MPEKDWMIEENCNENMHLEELRQQKVQQLKEAVYDEVLRQQCGAWIMQRSSMKTRKTIEELKQNWKSDPCWDIEDTEGFEEHKKELLEYRLMVEKKKKREEAGRVHTLCETYGCNNEMLKMIESLQYRITELEKGR